MASTFDSPRFHYTWGPHPPALRVTSGTTLHVVCPDSDSRCADGSELPPERRQVAAGTPLFAGNPLAGPIAIEQATSRDCLAIDLLAIQLDRPRGATLLAPAHGLLSQDQLLGKHTDDKVPHHLLDWKLDANSRRAEMVNPLGDVAFSVPLRPMVGCIGVCPNWGQSLASLFAGTFGGNLDLPRIEPGATLLLPVYHDGGLLMLGDLHAAQGAGEVVGGGIETSGIVTIQIHRIPGQPIPGPRIVTQDKIYAIATDGELKLAISHAYARLIDWIVAEHSLCRWDVYHLVSQAAEVELGGISVPNSLTVAVGLARNLLPPAEWFGGQKIAGVG